MLANTLLFFPLLSLKAMKENYRREQKRRIKELSSALKDPSVIILSSWLKVWLCMNSLRQLLSKCFFSCTDIVIMPKKNCIVSTRLKKISCDLCNYPCTLS